MTDILKLTITDYVQRIDHIIWMLQDMEILRCYPAITTLLSFPKNSSKNPEDQPITRRDYLLTLLQDIKAVILGNGERPPKWESILNEDGRIAAYGVTVSESRIAKVLKIGERKAESIPALFCGTQLLYRRLSKDEQSIELSKKAAWQNYGQRFKRTIYCYWVDDWTGEALNEKEKRAQQWINANKPAKIIKEKAVDVWGSKVANQIFAQDYRSKGTDSVWAEEILVSAFDILSQRSENTLITKAALLEQVTKTTGKNQDPELYWKSGFTALVLRRNLAYRPLRKEEKKIYGDTGRAWVLLPKPTEACTA